MNGLARVTGLILLAGLAANFSSAVDGDVEAQADRLFGRLSGTYLSLDDPRRPKLISLLAAGERREAAKIALDDDDFYNVTVRQWATPLSNRSSDSLVELNEATATIIGMARDDLDFREVLYGDYVYQGAAGDPFAFAFPPSPYNNDHYVGLDFRKVNLRRELKRTEPQNPSFKESAGILTMRTWGKAHLEMGTNRRAIEFMFKQFMCTNLDEMRDASMPETFIRRDVDRSPGGNSQTYLSTCRSCHGGLDGLAGAYAYLRFGPTFFGEGTTEEVKVTAKSNQNGNVYPAGHVTTNANWTNFFVSNQNASFGWRGPLSGTGVRSLGKMFANSRGFSRCMAKRTFQQLCYRSPDAGEQVTIEELADRFEKSGYKLRSLFEETAVLANCL